MDIKLAAIRSNLTQGLKQQQYNETVQQLIDTLQKTWDEIESPAKMA
jgi:hypothetical protein